MAKILIIEDDQTIQQILREILEQKGYGVAIANNGAEALEILQRGNSLCVILLDLMMPVMNGWEFRNAQLQDPYLAKVPTIICSGVDNVEREAATLGAEAFVQKPFKLAQLLQLLEQYC